MELEGAAVANRVIVPELVGVPVPQPEAIRHVFGGDIFATTWQVVVHAGPDFEAEALKQKCMVRLAQIDMEMSPYRPNSDLMRFNNAAGGEVVPLPAMTLQIVRYALEIAKLSDGAFDPALLGAVNMWGFGAQAVAEGLPSAAALAALKCGNWRQLRPQQDCMVQPGGAQLDLNAIAKGFAVDQLSGLCRCAGVSAALVEVGGELKGFGVQPDGMPWWIEIEEAAPRTLIALSGWAVATSGDARRSFIHEGRTYSHTVDPATQSPADTDIVSATVMDADCWRADALATAMMVMGERRAIEFANREGIPCLLRVRSRDGARDVLSSKLAYWA